MKQLIFSMVLLAGLMSMTACSGSSENNDEPQPGDSSELPVYVGKVSDIKLFELDLATPPYSDVPREKIHQVPMSKLPEWMLYMARSMNGAVITHTLWNDGYVYNLYGEYMSSYGYFFDSEGHVLSDQFPRMILNWELLAVLRPEVGDEYEAMNVFGVNQYHRLEGEWVDDSDPDANSKVYYKFRADGSGEYKWILDGIERSKQRFLYEVQLLPFSDGREWIVVKRAVEKQKNTVTGIFELSNDVLTSIGPRLTLHRQ